LPAPCPSKGAALLLTPERVLVFPYENEDEETILQQEVFFCSCRRGFEFMHEKHQNPTN
jgi:hypothetical protein